MGFWDVLLRSVSSHGGFMLLTGINHGAPVFLRFVRKALFYWNVSWRFDNHSSDFGGFNCLWLWWNFGAHYQSLSLGFIPKIWGLHQKCVCVGWRLGWGVGCFKSTVVVCICSTCPFLLTQWTLWFVVDNVQCCRLLFCCCFFFFFNSYWVL